MMILTEDGIICARDSWGRTPIIIGKKEGAYAASSETTSFPNLDFETAHEVGPGEIVKITAEGMEQIRPANKKMQVCSFIELLVVVLIIGILASVAVPQYEKAVKKARLTKVIPLVKTLANAEEVFYMSNGYYTGNVSELDVDMPAGGTLAGGSTDDGYLRFPDGTVIDLLAGIGHQPGGGSSLYVVARLQVGLWYVQFLENSAYPNVRLCGGDDTVCKSMGGTETAHKFTFSGEKTNFQLP